MWSANNTEWHTDKQSSTIWCPPISCQLRDKIKCIRMNDLYYALIIEKQSSKLFYFELRNRGMATLHRIETDYDESPDKMQLFSLPKESGWLFFYCGNGREYCYVLDNDIIGIYDWQK